MRKYTIFLFCTLLSVLFCFGQQSLVIDSLSEAIKTMPKDTNKVNALNKLSGDLWISWLLDSALLCANQAESLALDLKFNKGIALANQNLGDISTDQDNYSKALDYYLKAFAINSQMNYKQRIALNLSKIGNVYTYQGNYPEALNYYLKALTIDRQIGNKFGIANNLASIGSVYIYQDNYPKALDYYQKALLISKQIEDKSSIAYNLANIGNTYISEGNYPKALNYFLKALNIDKQMGNKYGIASDFSSIGDIYNNQGNYPKALEYYQRALLISKQIGDNNGIAFNLSVMGGLYLDQKKYNKAKAYLDSSMLLSKSIGAKESIRDNFASLSKLESVNGNYKSALTNYKNYIFYRDSLVNKENDKKIVQAQMNFQFEQQQIAQKAEQAKKDAVSIAESQKQKAIRNGFIIGFILMLFFAVFVFRSYRQKRQANIIITQQKNEVEVQKAIVDAKNKDITDSITYASRIQQALLTTDEYLRSQLKEHFILFKPRNIVSGDFYWNFSADGLIYIACCDCTGHGVPGAFMSLLNITLLNEAVVERKITRPDLVLNDVRENIIKALNPIGSEVESKDGMDAVFCTIDLKKDILQAACANNPIWIISKNGELKEIKADKMPVGSYHSAITPFSLKEVKLQKGDCIYLITDGYADQFGGEKDKKFKHKQLKELLLANAQKPMEEQKTILNNVFEKWKGNEDQVDDVCIIGIKI